MATARELIRSSLRLLNVIQRNETVDDEQIETDMFAILNRLIETLSIEGLIPFKHEVTSQALVASTASYSLSPNIYDLKYAYVVDGSYDYPLEIISYDEYYGIMNKSTESRPTHVYYNNNNATGDVVFYPTPDQSYTAKLISSENIDSISTVGSTLSYPLGYDHMLLYNLTVLAAPEFLEGTELSPSVENEAQKSLARIKNYNSGLPPKKVFDPILSKKTYNILNGYQS